MKESVFDVGEELLKSEKNQGKKDDPECSNKPTEKEKKPTQADDLLNIALSYPLFHDQNKDAYLFIDNEAVALRSKRLKHFLAHQLYSKQGKAPNSDSLNRAITVLQGKAIHENAEFSLNSRIAKKDDVFWYDLCQGKAIKITPHGWKIADAPILFKRYSHQQRQIIPIPKGDARAVFQFLNVDKGNELLVLVYIISCFIPDIPHPIFHPHGPQGSGKTTLCRIIKRIADPSAVETLITPRDVAELVQVVAHHHICLFDNLSNLPPWMSDILAQACTGSGFSKRQLFTDDDDIIYQVKRCIGLNGINLLISKPDLMDRSILLHLERIEPSARIEEAELWNGFEKERPSIFGGILDTLSKAMLIYPEVKLRNLPRMADFMRWGYAITRALGEDGEAFLHAYQGNIEKQNEEVIQNNTLAQAVIALMSDKDDWEGTIKVAWVTLYSHVQPNKLDTTFPRTERSLRRHLERIKTNLIDAGIKFQIGTRTYEGIPITFQKVSDLSSLSTHSSQIISKNEDNEVNVDNLQSFRNGKCECCIKSESCMMTETQRQLCETHEMNVSIDSNSKEDEANNSQRAF
jgi:hypothetical protein